MLLADKYSDGEGIGILQRYLKIFYLKTLYKVSKIAEETYFMDRIRLGEVMVIGMSSFGKKKKIDGFSRFTHFSPSKAFKALISSLYDLSSLFACSYFAKLVLREFLGCCHRPRFCNIKQDVSNVFVERGLYVSIIYSTQKYGFANFLVTNLKGRFHN